MSDTPPNAVWEYWGCCWHMPLIDISRHNKLVERLSLYYGMSTQEVRAATDDLSRYDHAWDMHNALGNRAQDIIDTIADEITEGIFSCE